MARKNSLQRTVGMKKVLKNQQFKFSFQNLQLLRL